MSSRPRPRGPRCRAEWGRSWRRCSPGRRRRLPRASTGCGDLRGGAEAREVAAHGKGGIMRRAHSSAASASARPRCGGGARRAPPACSRRADRRADGRARGAGDQDQRCRGGIRISGETCASGFTVSLSCRAAGRARAATIAASPLLSCRNDHVFIAPATRRCARPEAPACSNTSRPATAAAAGWIPFARYMEPALYAPGLGYYSGGARKFGPGGDFITAPGACPAFGRALAAQVEQVMRARPADRVGAGTGLPPPTCCSSSTPRLPARALRHPRALKANCANASSTPWPPGSSPGGACSGWTRLPGASPVQWWPTRCST